MKFIYFCVVLIFGYCVASGSKINRFIEEKYNVNTDETVGALRELISVMKGSVALQRENWNTQEAENELLKNSIENLNRLIDAQNTANELLKSSVEIQEKSNEKLNSIINEQEKENEHSKNMLELEKINGETIVEKLDSIIEGQEEEHDNANISREFQKESIDKIISEIDHSIFEFRKVRKDTRCNFPRNCDEIQRKGDTKSGIRTICPSGIYSEKPIDVLCNQDIDNGGWTVIQTRTNDVPIRENFTRSFSEYQSGFGSFYGEFWLGLENMHLITQAEAMELRIDLEDSEGIKKFAKYQSFAVGNSEQKYRLHVGAYSGNAGDALRESINYQNNQPFSTYDADNDSEIGRHCAVIYKGGYWYNACIESNLNGFPHVGKFTAEHAEGIIWGKFRGWRNSLAKVKMMCRPKI